MKNNVTVLSLTMFYENSDTVIFRVLGSVVYTIIDNYICLDYMFLFQYKLFKHDRNFENKLSDFSWMGIPEILMNFMSCHGFSMNQLSKFILTWRILLVTYYFSKLFEAGLDNVPGREQKKINAVDLHDKYSHITCKTEITSIVNTLNKIIIPRDVYGTYVSSYYYERHIEFFNLHFKYFVEQHLK